MGRFNGNLEKISKFLSSNNYLLIAVPYNEQESNHGKQHNYQLIYMNAKILKPSLWKEKYSKKDPKKIDKGVYCNISPSMSWQVWREIPSSIILNEDKTRVISIN